MSELEPEELAVLARARRGLSPNARDAARVRAAVGAAVTAGVGGSQAAARELTRAPSVVPAGMTGAAKLGAVVALATATGFGGYFLGFHAGVAEREQRHMPVPAVPAVVVPVAPVGTVSLAEAPSSRDPSFAPSPQTRGAKPERSAPSANPSTSVTLPAPDAHETSLELETRLLARVERALRDDNPRLALGLLGELDRTVPGGQLTEERQAARAMGHCELGSQAASKLALGFVEAHPASAYVTRVREACRAALEKKDEP